MAKSVAFPGIVRNLGAGKIEIIGTTLDLAGARRARFLKNPQRYLLGFFKAHKLATNALIADDQTVEQLKRDVSKLKPPKTAYMVINAHVQTPKKYRSRRIIVITKRK